jgi:NTE family protein
LTAPTLLDDLVARGERRTVADGDTLCSEGEISTDAFVVVAGALDAEVGGHGGSICVATHRAGSIVGEITTMIGGRRTATLRANGATEVIVVTADDLRAAFDAHHDEAAAALTAARERTDRSRVAALLSDELRAPDSAAIAAIANRVTWASIDAGETLFRRGDVADAAYLVVSGRLAITERVSSTEQHQATHPPTRQAGSDRRTIGGHADHIEVGRGGIVGEFGLLEARERSATVIALRDTSLARLSADDFRALTISHTSLAMGLIRRILDRAGDENSESTTARTFALAITADVDDTTHDTIVDTMATTLLQCGPSTVLSPSIIDEQLGQRGIADTAPNSFGEIRLAELIHQTETGVDHVMFDAGPQRDGARYDHWTARTLHHADQLVIIVSPDPDDDESRRITALIDDTPTRIPVWLAVLHDASTTRPEGATLLRDRFRADEVHHLRGTEPQHLARLARLSAGRGVGLVLSGGGARGHAHIGVFRALTEQGIPVDRVVGASMGSIVAAAIAQGHGPDQVLTDMREGASDLLDYTLPLVSLIKGERIVDVLERQFDGWDIADLWIPFACPSTNLTTAEVMVHATGPVTAAIRASVAIPGVLPPVVYDGQLLADGGVLENLPVALLGDDPSVGTVIASDVAPTLGPSAPDDYGFHVSGWSVAKSRFLPTWVPTWLGGHGVEPQPAYPGVTGTLLRSMLIGSSRSRDAHLASGVIDLYLDLDLTDLNILDFDAVDEAAERGYTTSIDRIADWVDQRGGAPCFG